MPCAPFNTTPVSVSECVSGSLINAFPPGQLKNTVQSMFHDVYRAEGAEPVALALLARRRQWRLFCAIPRNPLLNVLNAGRQGAYKHSQRICVLSHITHLLH